MHGFLHISRCGWFVSRFTWETPGSYRQRQNALWEEREKLAQIEWQAKKDHEEKERIRKEEEEVCIFIPLLPV